MIMSYMPTYASWRTATAMTDDDRRCRLSVGCRDAIDVLTSSRYYFYFASIFFPPFRKIPRGWQAGVHPTRCHLFNAVSLERFQYETKVLL